MPDLTELRDELAVLCGWVETESGAWRRENSQGVTEWSFEPMATLEEVAAEWKDGWGLKIWHGTPGQRHPWLAGGSSDPLFDDAFVTLCGGDSEYEARIRLTLAVLKEKAHA